MDTSDSVTVAKGHDVTDAMNSSNEGENRQEERAAQTIQVTFPFQIYFLESLLG